VLSLPGDKTPDAAHRMCSLFDLNDKPSVAIYKAIGIACGFVVSGTKKTGATGLHTN
jgi:hypothetical protein